MENERNLLLEAALTYAAKGWPIFPCHTIKNGHCSCGKDCGRTTGKHPRTKNGLKDATTSEKIIRAWWRTWPDANIAMATGGKAPEVLDCDVKDTVSGLETLADLQLQHGPLPETVSQNTGGGGRQYFFNPNGQVRNSQSFAPGLDTRGGGGYVILPPSLHRSGKRYEWANGGGDLADWPPWLLEEILKKQPQEDQERPETKNSEEIDRIMECAFLQHCDRDRATLPEDQWYAMVSNLCRYQGGPAKVHELSRGYAGYKPEETDAKILHALNGSGPHTCQHIKKMWDCGKTCGVKAPAGLAHRKQGKQQAPLEPPSGWTAVELIAQDFPEPRWILPGLLPEGMALLAGRPKVGKSWQALQVAIAVASGGKALGTITPERGRVLYLALEDSPRRLRKRLDDLLCSFPPPDNLHLFTSWPRVDAGGLLHMENFLKEHADTRLVAVDTLAKIRERVTGKAQGNLYQQDYEAIENLKKLADAHRVALLALTHLRKEAAEDMLDLVSGTVGITGAADTVMVLRRPRGEAEGTLFATGRDVEEQDLAVRFDQVSCLWTILGEAQERAATKERQQLLDLMKNEPTRAWKANEMASLVGKKANTVAHTLARMARENLIRPNSYGKYTLPPQNNNSSSRRESPSSPSSPSGPSSPTSPSGRDSWTGRTGGCPTSAYCGRAKIQGSAESRTTRTGRTGNCNPDFCDGCPYLHLPATWKPEKAMCQQASKFLVDLECCPLGPGVKG